MNTSLDTYTYFGTKVRFNSPQKLASLIGQSIEGKIIGATDYDCLINMAESEDLTPITKDKTFPFLTICRNELNSKDKESNFQCWSYLRYNVCARTIWKLGEDYYEVKNYTENDEISGIMCFKDFNKNIVEPGKFLIHGSLLNVGNKGILLVGNSRAGKTTLLVSMLEELKGLFVSDEETLIYYENEFRGHYTPGPISVRFPTILNSNLIHLLEDPNKFNATQIIDFDTFKIIIERKAYQADIPIILSRDTLKKQIGVSSLPSTKIDKIIFPTYSDTNLIKRRRLTRDETKHRLENYLMKRGNIFKLEYSVPQETPIPQEWLSNVESEEVFFQGISQIKKRDFLESLV